ncbi:MAG: deoxyguanosinetriphosphate triphosphohydrolase, partial [Mycobacteriales bacterium]
TATDRSPFERDRARVLHSFALRRLAAKTQVVVPGEDDFPRTRLTHSLECAQIGRELAGLLGCDPDVVDAACLAHDLGHPPFGHNGELALDAAAAGCGGFEGNAQSLRVLTRLEAKAVDATGRSVGLNLTRAVLDAATKYPWPREDGRPKYGVYADDRAVFDWLRAGAPQRRLSLEAQVMDWADDVAYSVHDLEDGVYAGLCRLDQLLDPAERRALAETTSGLYSELAPTDLEPVLAELVALPWWVRRYDGSLPSLVALKRMTSELIARFCASALTATRAAAGGGALTRYAADLVVPEPTRAECALLKGVTAHYVLGRETALASRARERELVAELVAVLVDRAPEALEQALRPAYLDAADDAGRLRVVVDQVASLTDVSARAWQYRLGAR